MKQSRHHRPVKPIFASAGVGILLLGTAYAFAQNSIQNALYQPSVRVYFSPASNEAESPTVAIIREIDEAKKSIRVQAYSFTSAPILSALKR